MFKPWDVIFDLVRSKLARGGGLRRGSRRPADINHRQRHKIVPGSRNFSAGKLKWRAFLMIQIEIIEMAEGFWLSSVEMWKMARVSRVLTARYAKY
jgi:hypothetical protein